MILFDKNIYVDKKNMISISVDLFGGEGGSLARTPRIRFIYTTYHRIQKSFRVCIGSDKWWRIRLQSIDRDILMLELNLNIIFEYKVVWKKTEIPQTCSIETKISTN